jgi:hypothetical protein
MIGNVYELEDNCSDADTPDKQMCAIRGGSAASASLPYVRCNSRPTEEEDLTHKLAPRTHGGSDIGLRCCADLDGVSGP